MTSNINSHEYEVDRKSSDGRVCEGLLRLSYQKNKICDVCQMDKATKVAHKSNNLNIASSKLNRKSTSEGC